MNQTPYYSTPLLQCSWCEDCTPAYWASSDLTKIACSKHLTALWKYEAESTEASLNREMQNNYQWHLDYLEYFQQIQSMDKKERWRHLMGSQCDPFEGIKALDICWDGHRFKRCGVGLCGHIARGSAK